MPGLFYLVRRSGDAAVWAVQIRIGGADNVYADAFFERADLIGTTFAG